MAKSYKLRISIIELDNSSFHIYTEAFVNGLKVNMLIDTGASMTVFDSNFFKEHFPFPEEKYEKVMSAGITANKLNAVKSFAESFRIGKVEIKNLPVILIDMKKINKIYRKVSSKVIHGLIGSDFLFSMNAVIDFSQSLLILKPGSI